MVQNNSNTLTNQELEPIQNLDSSMPTLPKHEKKSPNTRNINPPILTTELPSYSAEITGLKLPRAKQHIEFPSTLPDYELPGPLITRIRVVQDDERIPVVGMLNSMKDKAKLQLHSLSSLKIQFKSLGTLSKPGFAIGISTKSYETQALVMVKQDFWPFSKETDNQDKNESNK